MTAIFLISSLFKKVRRVFSITPSDNALEQAKREKNNSEINILSEKLLSHLKRLTNGTDESIEGRTVKGIKQLLQGKEGILRFNVQSKRVNFSARSVASADPTLKFGQIRVPYVISKYLTQPVRVAAYNQSQLQQLLQEGKINYITPAKTSSTDRMIKKDERFRVQPVHIERYQLQIGDVVERWLQNGDYVVFNRQPTLHKQSMMGAEVVIGSDLTIGASLSYTTPLNLDFDGDELVLHSPQTLEALAEIQTIMNVKHCIMSGQDNRPVMGLVLDGLSGSYLLTDPNTMMTPGMFNDCLMMLTENSQLTSLRKRLERHSVPYYSGRALFSSLLPEDFYYKHDTVVIVNGVMTQGRLSKKTVGASSNSIIHMLWKEYGAERTANFITDITFVINRWYSQRGFTVGLQDCVVNDPTVQKQINTIIEKARIRVRAMGEEVVSDPLQEERRQRQISIYVNEVQATIGKEIKKTLKPDNAFQVMIESGTKGTEANLAQISGALGQQFFMSERIKPVLTGNTRTLPYYRDDIELESRGFVTHSFLDGLSGPELFQHYAASRQGLMDTALKTSESGSMHHSIVKVLEDMKVATDGSVRNGRNIIFQYSYGEDGFEPSELIPFKTNVGSIASFINVDYSVGKINAKYGFF